MFVGHYAAAMAAKTAEPRAPLWVYVGACQVLDIGWSVLIMAGVEKMRPGPSSPGGAGLDLYFMPYTHSLPGSLAWSLGAVALCRLFKTPWRVALVVGATVFSHWLLDLLVHRPDLALWFGGPKVGLGLWNYPVVEMALEMGLVALAAAAWVAARAKDGRPIGRAMAFIALLVAVQMAGSASPDSGGAVETGAMALAVYLALTVAAWFADMGKGAISRP